MISCLIVSHSELPENSGLHVDSIGLELTNVGVSIILATPRGPEGGASRYGNCHIAYDDIARLDKPLDVVHLWTTRTHVREAYDNVAGANHITILHQEDNEFAITSEDVPRLKSAGLSSQACASSSMTEKLRYRTSGNSYLYLMQKAQGLTNLVESMNYLYSSQKPTCTFYPSSHLHDLNIEAQDKTYTSNIFSVIYSGTIHEHTSFGYAQLNAVLHKLNGEGMRARLLKTGMVTATQMAIDKHYTHVTNHGFVSASKLIDLISKSDLMVLPWGKEAFDEYRFPSKIPDYILLEKPFLVPNANIVRSFPAAFDPFRLETNGFGELYEKIKDLYSQYSLFPPLKFNEDQLSYLRSWQESHTWRHAASKLKDFYFQLIEANTSNPIVGFAPVMAASVKANPEIVQINTEIRNQYRAVAFYLPQYHPIPENDRWWGKGFSEWRGVASAVPQFAGHKQPKLPADTGFYDLRLLENIELQASLAHEAGIRGFCIYHYWFSGKQLLETPLEIYLNSELTLPFCVCWANEPWSRRYDGTTSELLMDQEYNTQDPELFADHIYPILSDSRYIKINGSPLLLIYNASHISNSLNFIGRIKARLRTAYSCNVHISIVNSFSNFNPFSHGADSSIEFTPYHFDRSLNGIQDYMPTLDFIGHIEDYYACYAKIYSRQKPPGRAFRCIFPDWDNTARRGPRAHIVANSNPITYSHTLFTHVLQSFLLHPEGDLVFINAWNEWGEGAFLEPDLINGNLFSKLTRISQDYAYEYFLHPCVSTYREFLKEAYSAIRDSCSRLTDPSLTIVEKIINDLR